jgi:uncharacterized membrane protein YcaP (DUF421 family)
MGKKQIGQLQPFELAIAIMISELASLPMQDTRLPLMHGIIPIITLLILQITVSILELKSEKMRLWFNGKPSILIKNGKIDIKELNYQKVNINDLIEELRLKNIYNLEDIEYAILETSGQLSIIPKTELSGVTKQDLKIKAVQETLPITLILDGKINTSNLKLANKTEKWLNSQLKSNKVNSYKDVFIALIDSKGEFYYQVKDNIKNK